MYGIDSCLMMYEVSEIDIMEKILFLKIKLLSLCFFLYLFIVSCTSFETKDSTNLNTLDSLTTIQADANPMYKIRFDSEATYTYKDGINSLTNFAVDSSGRIYFADGRLIGGKQTIQIYNPYGTFIGTIGREGRGPGEFESIENIKIRSGYLYAYDKIQKRITIFSLKSQEPVHTILLSQDNRANIKEISNSTPSPQHYFVQNDTSLLVGFRDPLLAGSPETERYIRYYQVNTRGQITSGEIFRQNYVNFHASPNPPPPSPPSLNQLLSLPFTRNALIAVSRKGYIYSAWTGKFLIKAYSPSGDYQHAIYCSYPNSILDEGDQDKLLKQYHKMGGAFERKARETEIPQTWPILDRMLLDGHGRLWVSTIVNDNDHYRWWVFTPKGNLLARFKWPGHRFKRNSKRDHMIMLIKNGYLYAYDAGENIFEDRIVRYRFQMYGD